MKKQIEDEIKRLKTERKLIINNIIELSLIDIDGLDQKIDIMCGKIEALEWCLNLIK